MFEYCLCLLLTISIANVSGHGMMLAPAARNSLWRFTDLAPVNYDDNALNCGGYDTQWSQNNGSCGPCGDAYSLPQPRPNEHGGKYGTGLIAATYQAGQQIDVVVRITANHRGYFTFALCNSNDTLETPECFEPLKVDNDEDAFVLNAFDARDFHVKVNLPTGVVCERCVLQWNYMGGNNWGTCADGTGRLGCGPQENFKNCADISIVNTNAQDLIDIP